MFIIVILMMSAAGRVWSGIEYSNIDLSKHCRPKLTAYMTAFPSRKPGITVASALFLIFC